DVLAPPQAGVEVLGPVHVGNRQHHNFKLHVHHGLGSSPSTLEDAVTATGSWRVSAAGGRQTWLRCAAQIERQPAPNAATPAPSGGLWRKCAPAADRYTPELTSRRSQACRAASPLLKDNPLVFSGR